MDYLHAVDISSSGMDYQRLRLEIIAANIANANSTRSVNGVTYKPLEAVATSPALVGGAQSFESHFSAHLQGIERVDVIEKNTAPRMVYSPNHPDANEDGFVAFPNVDISASMVDLISATRSYEANVKVLNAAKSMALRALEIGE